MPVLKILFLKGLNYIDKDFLEGNYFKIKYYTRNKYIATKSGLYSRRPTLYHGIDHRPLAIFISFINLFYYLFLFFFFYVGTRKKSVICYKANSRVVSNENGYRTC